MKRKKLTNEQLQEMDAVSLRGVVHGLQRVIDNLEALTELYVKEITSETVLGLEWKGERFVCQTDRGKVEINCAEHLYDWKKMMASRYGNLFLKAEDTSMNRVYYKVWDGDDSDGAKKFWADIEMRQHWMARTVEHETRKGTLTLD